MPTLSQMLGVAQHQNVSRPADGAVVNVRTLRDGALIDAAWVQALAIEGRIFCANFGSGTTAVAGKVTLTAAQPDLNIDVPKGTIVMPIAAYVDFPAMAGTANHFILQVSNNNIGNGTSTADPAPVNLRTDAPAGSKCTLRQAYTVSGTAPLGSVELFHYFQSAANAAGTLQFANWEPFIMPVLLGPASLQGYGVSTTTAMGFQAQVYWAEFASSEILNA